MARLALHVGTREGPGTKCRATIPILVCGHVGKWAGVKHHVAGGHGRDLGFWGSESLCVGFAAVSRLLSAICSSVWCFRPLREGSWVAC